jgi:hypothetical protein
MNPSIHAKRAAKTIREFAATTSPLTSEALAEVIQTAIDAARPKVIVTLSDGGLPSVYSTDKSLEVELVDDSCCESLEQHEANEKREEEIAADVAKLKLFEVA